MDRLKNLAELEAEKRFLEESPQNSPRPQASSTFMLKANDSNLEKSYEYFCLINLLLTIIDVFFGTFNK